MRLSETLWIVTPKWRDLSYAEPTFQKFSTLRCFLCSLSVFVTLISCMTQETCSIKYVEVDILPAVCMLQGIVIWSNWWEFEWAIELCGSHIGNLPYLVYVLHMLAVAQLFFCCCFWVCLFFCFVFLQGKISSHYTVCCLGMCWFAWDDLDPGDCSAVEPCSLSVKGSWYTVENHGTARGPFGVMYGKRLNYQSCKISNYCHTVSFKTLGIGKFLCFWLHVLSLADAK